MHYSLTIDIVRALLTDAQGLIACSISARAYQGPARQLLSGYVRLE